MTYGQELIIDLKDCDKDTFSRKGIQQFMLELCTILGVNREKLHFWDYTPKQKAAAPPHLKGTSAVQFLTTSNVTVHCLDDLGLVCLNVFTCGEISDKVAKRALACAVNRFYAKQSKMKRVDRG